MDTATVDETTFDLSVKDPNGAEQGKYRSVRDILDEIAALDAESSQALEKIGGLQ